MEEFKKIKVTHSSSIELLVDNPTNLKLIDKGAHGAVFQLSPDKCVKIYADKGNAELESNTYKRVQGSKIIPTLYEVGNNYIVIEFIKGISLLQYISDKKEISFNISKKLVSLLKEMKSLGFTRLDSSLRHIIITNDENLKVIDLVYAYVRNDTMPSKIFTELKEIGLKKLFLEHIKIIDGTLFNEWNKTFSK